MKLGNIMRLLVGALLLLLGAVSARAESDVELLNATLVAKFHFAEEARDGQMVGAYQVSFRNNGDTPVSKISLLLNPGLTLDHVIGPGGKRLKATSRMKPVKGFDYLELNQVEVTLTRPLLKGMSRREIIVHYRGYLEDLSQTGLVGVKETLHPDFTMIRAQSFGYPVFADADRLSIQEAWTHKPFHQVAFLDVPGLNTVVGNLKIAQKTTDGDTTKFEMKSEQPTGLMSLAIGPYQQSPTDIIAIAKLAGRPDPTELKLATEDQAAILEDWLGPLPSGRRLTLVMTPEGFNSMRSGSSLFLPPNAMSPASGKASVKQALFSLWRTNTEARPNHWANGLDSVLWSLVHGGETWTNSRAELFDATRSGLSSFDKLHKTSIADFVVEGMEAAQEPVSALAFATLYDLLGPDEFFALVRGLRADLSVGYVDMQSVADYLDQHIKDKKARSFAENWFSRGRIGKDMAKAGSFEELVALYR